ncbi:MAG: helix-turn-helix domain-containing protein [Lachnospiraceae bacterium]|nr:helix-turn-helix domain-containing protein [Lachnospiraceae bacterium]
MSDLRLKSLRKSAQKTQHEVCCELNIEQSTLANYENGKRVPKADTLIRIAEYYHCSVDYLLGREGNIPASNENAFCPDIADGKAFESRSDYSSMLDANDSKFLSLFRQLNECNRDIIFGDMQRYLKEQRYEEPVAAEPLLKQAQ